MEYCLIKMLGLQAFKVLGIIQEYKELYFKVISRRKTADCPYCLKRTNRLYGYLKNQKIKHIRIGERLSYLNLTKRRFYCQTCHKVFVERLTDIKYRNRISQHAKAQILTHLTDRSFKASSRQTGIGYHSQKRYLIEKVKPFLWDWSNEAAGNDNIALGIDEISFSGHDMVRTITNITNKQLKTILPDDLQQTLILAIKNIPKDIKLKIKEVVMDLNGNSKSVIELYLPEADIVADRFHIIQDANNRISQERIPAQERVGRGFKIPKKLFEKNKEDLNDKEKIIIKQYFKSFPELKFYWRAKEKLRDMYHMKSRKRAEMLLNSLITAMAYSYDRDLKQWARTLNFWKIPILNFFNNRTTNGYTEGVNTKLKLVKRISYGFKNKEVFIRKAMLSFLPLAIFTPHLMT